MDRIKIGGQGAKVRFEPKLTSFVVGGFGVAAWARLL